MTDRHLPDSLERLVEQQLNCYFAAHAPGLPPAGLLGRVTGEVERVVIRRALEETGYNQLQAARLLGLNRNTLHRKMTAYGIARPHDR